MSGNRGLTTSFESMGERRGEGERERGREGERGRGGEGKE